MCTPFGSGQMNFTVNGDIKLDVFRMDGSFAVATYSESGKDDMRVKAEFFEKSDHIKEFDSFLQLHDQEKLIIRVDSFECEPELMSSFGSTEKTYVIVYQDYESTLDQLLKDKPNTFWEYKITDGIERASITPRYQQFLKDFVVDLLRLHEKKFKHGAIEDLKRCVLLSKDNLQSFKMIPSGKADIKEEKDLHDLSIMMSKLSPHCICPYDEHARKFLTNSKRSLKGTLMTLKKHPLLVPPSHLKIMVDDVSHIWSQNPNSREFAEQKFIGPFIAKTKRTEHYQLWVDQIEEWIKHKEKRAEQGLKSASTEQIKNMGDCMRHRITEYHNYSFVELVRYLNNKFKHAWERDGNNTATFTEAEFIDAVIEIFPDIHVILFEYLYCSKSCFSGPHNTEEEYPCEGYCVTEMDVRF